MESVESVDEFEVDNGAPCYSLGLTRIGSTQKLELCEIVSVGTCTRGKMNVYLPEHMHGGGAYGHQRSIYPSTPTGKRKSDGRYLTFQACAFPTLALFRIRFRSLQR